MCAQTKPATATSTTTTTLDGMGNNTAPSTNIESSSHPSSAASVVSFHNVAPPDRWFPWLVPAFVVTNVAAFAATMYVNDCPSTHTSDDGGLCVVPSLGRFSFEPLSINPLFGPSTDTLDLMGALNWKRVVWEGEWWRLFACVWLHAGVVHLLANMLSLLFIGIRLEQEFGFAKIGVLYVISGFGGSLMSSFSIQSKISVGASGALFGLLGAMLSELITNWSIYANKFAALITLIVIIGINMAVGFIPHVDSSAHIGGFITGFLLGFVLLIRPQFGWVNRKYIPPGYDMDHVKPKHKCYQQLLWATALVLLITGFTGGLFKLFHPVPVHV